MKVASLVTALALVLCCVTPAFADGVDRASAARRPNEAGALPESDTVQTYGEDLPAPAVFPAGAELRRAELPATSSPLGYLALAAAVALAAAAGLTRLERHQS